MMTKEEVYKQLAEGERIVLECKKAENKVPNSIWASYSAFANTYGGLILLGVYENMEEKDRSKRFVITGVSDAPKLRIDLWNTLNNKEKVSINLLRDDDVDIVEIEGKDIIAIHVPQARYNARPVYINGNWMTGAYKRNHEGDYHVSDLELKMILRDANDTGNDGMRLPKYGMKHIDEKTLNGYRQMFVLKNPDHPLNTENDKEFLRVLGGYYVEEETGEEGLTLAGLLLFGKGLTIRDRFDNLRLDYLDMTNLVGDQRYSDRVTYDGTWENNLFNFLRLVITRLTRDLPRPFKLEGVTREDDTPLHKAVREACTNMIIHADYLLTGLLKVEKYDDRFVLSNPGLLKLPLPTIYKGGESRSRNPRMQTMLRMIGYGENIGTGFATIVKTWDSAHWMQPQLREDSELMKVELTLYQKKQNDTDNKYKNVSDKNNDVKARISDTKITARQQLILGLIKLKPTTTVKEMSVTLSVTERTISRDLAKLQEQNIVKRHGADNDGYWEVIM